MSVSSQTSSTTPLRPIVLCADDYAIAPGVSRTICELIQRGRLTATGCMTVSPFWREHARWLQLLAGRADIGLHLTLTDLTPLGLMPRLAPDGRLPTLGALMKAAFLGRLDGAELRAEIARQIDEFTTGFGRAPDFVDGHKHVHLLPGVRSALFDVLRARANGTARPYLRNCHVTPAAALRRGVASGKALILGALSSGFARRARAAGFATNPSFSGVYDFSGRIPYEQLLERFLADLPAGAIVMCHPGEPDDDLRRVDAVVDQRAIERNVLAGDALPAILARAGVMLARFPRQGVSAP